MFCNQCTINIIEKLTPNDIYLLHELQERNTPQTGKTRKEILNSLKESMSVFQLQQAIMRMELLGLVGSQKQGISRCYHITESGIYALSYLDSK